MKRLLFLASTLALLLSPQAFGYSHAQCLVAQELATDGIIQTQVSCDEYSLDRPLFRQELAAVALNLADKCWRIENIPSNSQYVCRNVFSDVSQYSPNTWVCRSAEILANNDIVTTSRRDAFGNVIFRPERNVTKAEALSMLLKAGNISTSSISYNNSSFGSDFVSWQKSVVQAAYNKGIIFELGNFHPNHEILRREVFEITNRIHDICMDGSSGIISSEVNFGPTSCSSLPSNALWLNQSTCEWICQSGYTRLGNTCYQTSSSGTSSTSCNIPSNAYRIGSGCNWECEGGYVEINGRCYYDSRGSGSSFSDDVELRINDRTVDEDDDEARVSICLSERTDEDVEVEWRTRNGTARSGSDYESESRTTRIDEGDLCETIEIEIEDDNRDESTEYFFVEIERVEYDGDDDLDVRDDEARVTIRDDDGGSSNGDIDLEIDDETVDEDDDEVRLDICLSERADDDVDVEWRTRDGTARSGSDYESESRTTRIDEGDLCETITIEIEDDNRDENSEYFYVEIEDVDTDGDDDIDIRDDEARVTIRDDDGSSSSSSGDDIDVEIDDETVDEDDGEVELEICLSERADDDVEVEWRTRDGTARAGSDYESESRTTRIDEGDLCETITIEIEDDSRLEVSEYFRVEIRDVDTDGDDDINIRDDEARVTIRDDDGFSSGSGDDIDLRINDRTVDEDDDEARLTICLSERADDDVDVEWRTRNGTARSGSDYESESRTTRIDEGDLCETITIEIEDDSREESTEYFYVEIEDVDTDGDDDIDIRDDEARVTIRDDDDDGYYSYDYDDRYYLPDYAYWTHYDPYDASRCTWDCSYGYYKSGNSCVSYSYGGSCSNGAINYPFCDICRLNSQFNGYRCIGL